MCPSRTDTGSKSPSEKGKAILPNVSDVRGSYRQTCDPPTSNKEKRKKRVPEGSLLQPWVNLAGEPVSAGKRAPLTHHTSAESENRHGQQLSSGLVSWPGPRGTAGPASHHALTSSGQRSSDQAPKHCGAWRLSRGGGAVCFPLESAMSRH